MSDKIFNEIGQKLTVQFGTTVGQMFGKPCLKINNKAFSAFFKREMVFKLGEYEVNRLKGKYLGSVNWDPSERKRPMKDWLQVPTEFSDHWVKLSKQALEYVKENK